ncbi:hypothetical protein [Ruegeria profundi]|uniref:hypothetical protein n=1 Tax=Ruegeria profundi TaxID=1685378 RepID=UPI001CD62627|nr:hypothetical protein [Ruegeria profundi]MCA0927145.1 hypothetical protein [Ruegeria profundi]
MTKQNETKPSRTEVQYKSKSYKSMADLAKAHDLNPSAVRRVVRQGKSLDESMAAALRVKKEKAKADAA